MNSSPLKLIFTDTVFYGGLGLISRGFTFLTFPLLTRAITIDDFALFDTFTVLASFLILFLTFGAESILFRFIPEISDKNERSRFALSLIITVFVLSALISFLIHLIVIFSQHDLLGIKNTSLILFLMALPCLVIYNSVEALLRITFQKKRFATLVIGNSILILGVIFTFTLLNNRNIDLLVTMVCLAWMFSGLVSFLFMGIDNFKGFVFRRIEVKYFKYGIPLAGASLLTSLSPILERTIIIQNFSLKDLGFFAAAYKIALLLSMIITALQTASFPILMSIKNSETFDLILNIYVKTSFLLLTLIALPLVFYSENLIIVLAGSDYISASDLLTVTLSLVLMQFSHAVLTIGFLLSHNTTIKLLSQFACLFFSFVFIIFNVAHISVFEMLSIILAIRAVFLVIDFNLAQQQYKIRWTSLRCITSLIGYFALIWYISFVDEYGIQVLIFSAVISFVIFLVTLSRSEFELLILSARKMVKYGK